MCWRTKNYRAASLIGKSQAYKQAAAANTWWRPSWASPARAAASLPGASASGCPTRASASPRPDASAFCRLQNEVQMLF